MKKILYVTDLLVPYRVDWINALSAYFSIDCFHFGLSDETRNNKWIDSVSCKFNVTKIDEKRIFGLRYSSNAISTIKKSDYDIYLIDGYNSLIQYRLINWLTKHKRRVYVNVDGIDLWRPKKGLDWLKDKIKRKIYKSGAKFLCGSTLAADFIKKEGAIEQNVFTHHFSSLFERDIIDIGSKNKKQELFKKNNNLDNSKIVLAVGRFIQLKRYEDLLLAWHSMPNNYHLFIVGGGELKNKYLENIRLKGLKNVHIIDFLEKDKLNQLYVGADLFVHTSETETWGLVINEAMSKGCPCIATNHCVAGVELIQNGYNGYLFEVGDFESLRSKILNAVAEPNNSYLKANAIQTIKDYTIEVLCSEHKRIFEEY